MAKTKIDRNHPVILTDIHWVKCYRNENGGIETDAFRRNVVGQVLIWNINSGTCRIRAYCVEDGKYLGTRDTSDKGIFENHDMFQETLRGAQCVR